MKLIIANKCNKGFTLMEMLIVVAIMSVLVAVSFPVFSKAIDKVNVSVDDANLRVAKSFAHTQYLMKENEFSSQMYFDLVNERFVSEPPTSGYGESLSNSGKVISVEWNPVTQALDVKWVEP